MIEVPGTAGRFFKALGEAGINVILISQASSEHSICIAVDPQRAAAARDVVNAEFARERAAGLVDDLVVEEDVSILAIVGVDMCRRPGISGRIFNSLGAAGVNVRAIAQGSSELNISLAIASADERRALATVHDAFFDPTRLNVFLLGVGTVGGELLRQLRESPAAADWSLSGIASSRRMSLERRRRDRDRWSSALLDGAGASATDLEALAAFVRSTPGPSVVVDCTASDGMVDLYAELLAAGVDVVTANKKPLAAPQSSWHRLLDAQAVPGRAGCTTRPPSAPVCRWCARSPTRWRPAIACCASRDCSPARSLSCCIGCGRALRSARRSPRRASAASPSPTCATISRARTLRASS